MHLSPSNSQRVGQQLSMKNMPQSDVKRTASFSLQIRCLVGCCVLAGFWDGKILWKAFVFSFFFCLVGFFMRFRHITTPSGNKIYYKNTLPFLTLATVCLGAVMWTESQWRVQCHWNSLQKPPCWPFARLRVNGAVLARTDYSFDAVIEISQRVYLNKNLLLFKWGRQVIKFLSQHDRLISQRPFRCCRCTVSWNHLPRSSAQGSALQK